MDLSSILTSRTVAWIGFVCIVLSALAALWAMVKLSYQRALGKPMPRNALTATLDVLAELAVNVVGAVSRGLKLGTGESLFKPTVPLTGPEALALAATKQAALGGSATRPSVAPPAPTPAGVAHPAQVFAPSFDPGARQTIAPEAVASIHHATTLAGRDDGQRGSTSLSAAVVAACLVGLVLSVGAMLSGCPASQQLTRPALGAVDGCEPRATRCAPDGRPQVCSGSRRWTDADVACATAGQVAAVCCLTRSPITGHELHACVLAERCIATDGGL